jgi:hypothetical protein
MATSEQREQRNELTVTKVGDAGAGEEDGECGRAGAIIDDVLLGAAKPCAYAGRGDGLGRR